MSTILTKATKTLFAKHLSQYEPPNPRYEYYTDPVTNKQKRRARGVPPGLSARDVRILKTLQKRAYRLDNGFSLLGVRFGWAFFIGLVPVVGDFADVGLSYFFVLRKAQHGLELPSWIVSRMAWNNAVAAGVGFVPLVGDVGAAAWRANSRNVQIIEEYLRLRGEEYLRLQAEGGLEDPGTDDSEGEAVTTTHNKSGASQSEKRKGKGKAAPRAKNHDKRQLKPGAGLKKGEVVAGVQRPTAAAPKAAKKSAFSFFSHRRAPPPGEMGRFVENVDTTPSELTEAGAKQPR